MSREVLIVPSAVQNFPLGHGPEEVEICYFHLGRKVSEKELAHEYEILGLVPDPLAQIADNEANPYFADSHPNLTHWQDDKGQWCSIAFDCGEEDEEGRTVHIRCNKYCWSPDWWYGGVPKNPDYSRS